MTFLESEGNSDQASLKSVVVEKDPLYLLFLIKQEEIDCLIKRQQVTKRPNCDSNSNAIEDRLKNGIRVLDIDCDTGTWVINMSQKFPQSTFYGIDFLPHAFTQGERCKPKNCSITAHDISKPFPFPENYFDFAHRRLVTSGTVGKDWQEEVSNVIRVVKPGGYVEFTETLITDIVNCGPKLGILIDFLSKGSLERGVRISQARKIENYLNESGAIDVRVRLMAFPLVHSGPVGEFWYKDIMFLYRKQLGTMVAEQPFYVENTSDVEDIEKFRQFLLEIEEECIQYRSTVLMYSFYAQKPKN